ncbi:amino acid ABC transporter permease [Metasolibacillus meyeri]|uniref:Amino acid ABC transporter permease n=1 Tax=Metasolibacillus meyeri TaxID=1071052 RepID=A0AAW9NT71_9BACL|nr:amino acid ABC transporter permease [Metasolibacillus meyeri]MEC1179601.1 amino acid ABC transporter permease [Metasolibacillus meyeri]
MNVIIDNLPKLLEGLKYTIYYSVVSIVLAVIIGLVVAVMKLSKSKVLKISASVYVEIFRSTPLLVQLFFIVFGLAGILPMSEWFGQRSYPVIAATLTLALHQGAYISEIIRAGILSVNKGQREASESIGMSEFQIMRFIILPQAFKRMIPPLVNQSAQAIKDTSLLAPIGIIDLVYRGQIIISTTFEPFAIWVAVGIIYFIIIFSVSQLAGYLERRMKLDTR